MTNIISRCASFEETSSNLTNAYSEHFKRNVIYAKCEPLLGGLSGLCVGFATACGFGLVQGMSVSSLPEQAKHAPKYSKLLLDSFWSLIPKEVARDDVSREKHPQLVKKIEQHFTTTMANRLGLSIKRCPQQGYIQLEKNCGFETNLKKVTQEAGKMTNCIFFIVSKKNASILDWHVFGLYSHKQVFFDASANFIYSAQCTKDVFNRVITQYVEQHYKGYDCHMLSLNLKDSKRHLNQNCLIHLGDQLHTAYMLSRHGSKNSLLQAGLLLADLIPGLGKFCYQIARYVDPRNFETGSPQAFKYVHGKINSALDEKEFERDIYFFKSYESCFPAIYQQNNLHFYVKIKSKKECDELCLFFKNLINLGKFTHPLVTKLTLGVLTSLTSGEATNELFEGSNIVFDCIKICMKYYTSVNTDKYQLFTIYKHLEGCYKKNKPDSWCIKYMKLLLRMGQGDVGDVPTSPQDGALYVACQNGSLRVIKVLINNGADPFAPFYKNDTPLAIAKKKNHLEVVTYLESLSHIRS
jgi:hypothetical protein